MRTRRSSLTDHAWAPQPPGEWGEAPSVISGRWPRQFEERRASALSRMERAAGMESGRLERRKASAREGMGHGHAVPL